MIGGGHGLLLVSFCTNLHVGTVCNFQNSLPDTNVLITECQYVRYVAQQTSNNNYLSIVKINLLSRIYFFVFSLEQTSVKWILRLSYGCHSPKCVLFFRMIKEIDVPGCEALEHNRISIV